MSSQSIDDATWPVGTVTFLLTDVEASTELWERDRASMLSAMARHDAIVSGALAQHGGVRPRDQGEGDSVMAVFDRAADAVACAVAIQLAFQREPWPETTPIRVRMGLHTGEAELRDGNYRGPDVARCARVRGLATGEQVITSSVTASLVRGALPGVTLLDLGRYPLKGFATDEHVFQVCHHELRSAFPPLPAPDPLDALEPALLVLTDDQGARRRIDLEPARRRLVVGRVESSDVALVWDGEVSRVHAELEYAGGRWTVKDDDLSRNGTFVNGQRITGRHPLAHGDVIRFGATEATYVAPVAAAGLAETIEQL